MQTGPFYGRPRSACKAKYGKTCKTEKWEFIGILANFLIRIVNTRQVGVRLGRFDLWFTSPYLWFYGWIRVAEVVLVFHDFYGTPCTVTPEALTESSGMSVQLPTPPNLSDGSLVDVGVHTPAVRTSYSVL